MASPANMRVSRSGSSLIAPRMSSRFMAVSADECSIRRSAAAAFLERDVLRAVPYNQLPERGELVDALVDRREVVAGQLPGLACEHGRTVRKEDLRLAYPTRIQEKLAGCGVAGVVLIAEVELEVAKRYPGRLSAPPCLEDLRLEGQHRAEPGAGLRRLFSLQAGQEPHVRDDDLDAHRVAAGLMKSTASSRPSQTTVVWAGSVRATILPPRTTSRRGATSRMASMSVGAAKTQRSARHPGSSP